MYNSLNDEMKTIADRYIDMFKNTSESEMRKEVENILYSIKDGGGLKVNDEQFYGMSDEERLDLFVAIYENILDEVTKRMFVNEILDNTSLINSSINPKIIDYFEEKAQEFGEQDLNDSDSSETETEEPVEEETKDPIDYSDGISETEEPVEEEEKTEEKSKEEKLETKEGPEITKYKEETEELRQKLVEKEKELEELLNSSPVENPEVENNELDEIIAQTTLNTKVEDNEELKNLDELIERLNRDKGIYERQKENFVMENPNYESFVDLKKTYELLEKAIVRIDGEIKKAEQDKEIIKNKPNENDNKTIHVEVRKLHELYQKEIEKLENQLKILNDLQDKYYKENKGIPLEIYGMKTPLENLIEKMKKDLNEVCGIRFDININAPENHVLIENVLAARELDEKTKTQLDDKFKSELPEKENENTKDIEALKAEIEAMKTQLGERDKNIETYYAALEDINKISNEKDKESEIVKQLTESAKEKINSITDDNLKRELNEYLEKALSMKIENVKKDPKKWHKWVAGIAGLVAGGVTVAFAPGAALGVIIGTQVAKKAVNMYHKYLKKKETELGKENEITGIEKPNEKQKNIANKFKEFMKNEENIKNINWFLNGATIGAATMGIVNAVTPDAPMQGTTPTPNPTPTDPYSQIKIGDNASGLDLTQGYDQANWAANNVNAETLNQAIMQDGNSVINSVGIVKDGSTQIVNTAGKSLAEIAQQYGVSPEELVMNIGNQQGAARAWVDAAEAVGRTL